MNTKKFNNLISLFDLESSQIKNLLNIAIEEKNRFKMEGPGDFLKGKSQVLIFEKPSLRTRVTFEVALTQVGGSTINLEPSSISLGKRESVKDGALNLSRRVDVIVARTFKQELVEELAEHATVPVVNALTDQFHPCQALAFAQTLIEKRGDLKGCTIVFVGDGNNVANSLAVIAANLGMNFTLACPKGYEQSPEIQKRLNQLFNQSEGKYTVGNDPMDLVKGADVIYTDVWVSMGEEDQEEEKQKHFEGFQVNSTLVKEANQDCLVSHCLPAHRGVEITDEVMDSENSICFDEAENRLHAQKAVLLSLLNPKFSIG